MKKIQDALQDTSRDIPRIALVGIGGSGKTTLARYYAKQYGEKITWEINAETKESLLASFENLAYALSRTEEEKNFLTSLQAIPNTTQREEKILLFVKQHLRKLSPWVLIYDNVESYEETRKYIPSSDVDLWGKGKVIITTQDETLAHNSCIKATIHVEELQPEEQYHLFNKILFSDSSSSLSSSSKIKNEESIRKFLQDIPPYPLDTALAANYIRVTNVSYKEYLSNVTNCEQCFLSLQEGILKETNDYTKTRYKIIILSVERLIEKNKEFKGLLFFLSLLDSQNIPKKLLAFYKNKTLVDTFVYSLKKYSLILNRPFAPKRFKNTFTIHRTLQERIRSYIIKTLGPEKNELLHKMAQALEQYTNYVKEKDDMQKITSLTLHCEALLNHDHLLTNFTRSSIEAHLGSLYVYLKKPRKAAKVLEESINTLEKLTGKSHSTPQMAYALTYLGQAYSALGDYEKAKESLERSLSIYKILPEKNYIDVARCLSALGNIYRYMGFYKTSKKFLKESLEIYRKYDPQNYGGIARTLGLLGCTYRELTQYEKARTVLEESLSMMRAHLQKKHFYLAWLLTSLGTVYGQLGRYKEAKTVIKESGLIYKQYFPKDHTEIAWTLSALGVIYRDLGNYEKAKHLLEKSLAICKNLPENHHRRAYIISILGNVYSELKNYKKAKQLLTQSLKIYEEADEHRKKYRKLHQKTNIRIPRVKNFLGSLYLKKGKYEKARTFLEEALADYQKFSGKDHIEVASILKNLGEVYLLEKDFPKAREFLEKALEIFIKQNHPEKAKVLALLQSYP